MEREKELSILVQKLLHQQKKLKEMCSELNMPLSGERKAKENEKPVDVTRKSMLSWIGGSEFDPTINDKEYTDEEIEELKVFRKTHFSDCHNKDGLLFKTSNNSPPPKGKHGLEETTLSFGNEDNYYIENYTLNKRMFATSVPTLSTISSDPSHTATDRIVHVSVPLGSRGGNVSKPGMARKNCDSVNTMGLHKHCCRGFQSSNYPALPTHQPVSIESYVKRND